MLFGHSSAWERPKCTAQEGKPLPMSSLGQNRRRKIQRPVKAKMCVWRGELKPNN